jgi:hypothetical protein
MTLIKLLILEIRVQLKTAHFMAVLQEKVVGGGNIFIRIMMCSTLFSRAAKSHTFRCFSSGF